MTQLQAVPEPFWRVAVAESLAVIAVTFFAGVQLHREHRRAKEHEAGADAQIGALGYLLRRQLRSWFSTEIGENEGVEKWLRDAQNAKTFQQHLDRAEGTMIDMVTLTSDASESVSKEVREAFVLFLAGTDRLNRYASTERPDRFEEEWDWMRLRKVAEKDLRDCLTVMERHIVNSEILRAEQALHERRANEDPFHRIGNAMEEEIQAEEDAERQVATGRASLLLARLKALGKAPRQPE